MDILEKLNEVQRKAAKHINGPLLVLAGAGSGKTRVVSMRIAYLIDQGIHPAQILAVTFTNKAAGEMKERIHHLLANRFLEGSPTICTFHSLGVRILRESIHLLGYGAQFLIYDEEDSNKLLKGCLDTLQVKKDADFKTYKAAISNAKNHLQGPSDLILSEIPEIIQGEFKQVYQLYQHRLKEANAVDFDDLLFMSVRLMKEYPEALCFYQKKWPYLLIDEYQDTNHAQYLMARLIVGSLRNIFVVGDPDQSIYSWRGANIQNILNFEKDYPGAQIVRLEQNYRSRKNILDAANHLVRYNESRYEKNLWSDRGEGAKISLFVGGSDREEAGFVTHEIERLHTFHHISLNEMAVFYRTNFQSRIFEDFLLRRRIPYVIVGGISFYHRKEIKDILAILRMVSSDRDFISFERTINLPKRGIGLTTIEKIRDGAFEAGLPILQYCKETALRLSAKQKEGLKEYIDLIEHLRSVQQERSLQRLVTETVRASRYLEVLQAEKETYADRKANLDELVTKAHEWEILNDSASLDTFLEELSLKSSLDEANYSKERVSLMTIHNGKGLEFDSVFLVGMEEDLFPHANSKDHHAALEEERRLCYVGMTRAKERLYLTAAESRFLWGTHRMMRPSRFLREIPKEYMERMR